MKKLKVNTPTICGDRMIDYGVGRYLRCKDFVSLSINGKTYRVTRKEFNYLLETGNWELL